MRRSWPIACVAIFVAIFSALLTTSANAQRGDVAATYAFQHTWDYPYEYSNDCANFVSKCWKEGGWGYRSGNINDPTAWFYSPWNWRLTSATWRLANNFENHLWATNRAKYLGNNSAALQPGDIIVADWGDGVTAPGVVDGYGDHVMIVHHNLGNGDVVYCQHSGGKMRRLYDVRSAFNRAQFRLYHVNGNNSLEGRTEGRMYREASRPEVYLFVNRGKLWVHTLDDVMYWGGWGAITIVPDGTLSAYGGTLPLEGTMVRERNRPEVYLVRSWPYISHILTEQAVNRYGGWPAVRIVPDYSLDSFWRSSDIW